MDRDLILDFIKKVQASAQIGLSFSKDPYDLERSKELKELSVKMLEHYLDNEKIEPDLYLDTKYPTAKVSVRSLVVNENNEVLCVKEQDSGKWSLPGGWCDIDTTAMEAAIKETSEESGFIVEIERLLGVVDHSKHYNKSLLNITDIYFLGKVVGGEAKPNFEVSMVDWFSIDNLPDFGFKSPKNIVELMFDVYINNKPTYFE